MKKIDFQRQIFIQPNTTLLEALKIMNEIKRKLLIVIENEKFVGVLSIGDIQRAILNKHLLADNVVNILRKEITICRVSDSPEFVKKQMLEKRTECMPILDENNNLVDLWYWEDIFGNDFKRKEVSLNFPVVIMAGGKGTRLKPLTNILPKPLIPINEKTIIEDIMDRFVEVGCSDFYISVNYKSELIKFYLNNLDNKNYKITYFEEKKPLGTAGSMFLIKEKIKTTFFVSNCDILIKQDLEEIYNYHYENKNVITIVSALKNFIIPYGTIDTEKGGKLLGLDEKPEQLVQINTGMYILEPETLYEIPENEFFHITDLIERIRSKDLKVGVFPIPETSWQDIGSWDEYYKILNQ
jgi:dTDP-glucose pyrophosphorylase